MIVTWLHHKILKKVPHVLWFTVGQNDYICKTSIAIYISSSKATINMNLWALNLVGWGESLGGLVAIE
jgi:hypothetical protein